MRIVLVEPEIPQNTGNIARTCTATGLELHLVHPLGFKIDEKQVKRAGLDYWDDLKLFEHKNLDAFLEYAKGSTIICATTKSLYTYAEMTYPEDSFILFGKESKGLPEDLLKKHKEHCIRIPMIESARSLNLSNAVAIVAYEALRQHDFAQLSTKGTLHNSEW